MDSLSRAYGAAAGAEYDKQYGRLLDPIKIGSNAAQMTGSAGNTLSNAYGQTGQNQAQNATSLGQNNASFLVGLGSLPMSLYNTYQTQNQNQQYLDWLKTQ
jgi:hypothetical protein